MSKTIPTTRDVTIWRMFGGGERAQDMSLEDVTAGFNAPDQWESPYASFGMVETYCDRLAALGFSVEITRLPADAEWTRVEGFGHTSRKSVYTDWSVDIAHGNGADEVLAARGWASGPNMIEALARALMDMADRLGIEEHEGGSLKEALET